MNDFFGPLGKENCIFYYILEVFFFLAFIVSAFMLGYETFYKRINIMENKRTLWIVGYSFLMYYLNRLTYSICINSLH